MIATATKEYKALLAETAPRQIHTESENEVAIQQLEKLTEKRSPSCRASVDRVADRSYRGF